MERLLAGRRVVIRATEWLLWDVRWMYRRAMEIAAGMGRDKVDDGAAVPSSPSSSATCNSEVCRYCRAWERTLLWEDFTFLINFYLLIVLHAMFWAMGTSMLRMPVRFFPVHFIIQVLVAFKFMDTLAPAAAHQRVCSRLHGLWRSLQELRSESPGLHCVVLCIVAFGLWLLGHIETTTFHSMYGIFILVSMIRLPNKLWGYLFLRHREWQCDSEIEDEFLPVVTEANLQVLNRVGETGDHSPTPTSVLSDTQNDSFYDEDFIEGLQGIAFNMPYHGEGSTDGVELSELELSVGENDAEEDCIKFQAGHFEKSSSSSSEEEVDGKKIIAVSSDESNGESDFEIIDKEEIAKIEM